MLVRLTVSDGCRAVSSESDVTTALLNVQRLLEQGLSVELTQVEQRVVGFARALVDQQDQLRELIDSAFAGVA